LKLFLKIEYLEKIKKDKVKKIVIIEIVTV
jgi:hypothetical protein